MSGNSETIESEEGKYIELVYKCQTCGVHFGVRENESEIVHQMNEAFEREFFDPKILAIYINHNRTTFGHACDTKPGYFGPDVIGVVGVGKLVHVLIKETPQ